MRELSEHILDLVYNCLEAGARTIEVAVTEDTHADRLTLSVVDDGRGMEPEDARKALDPLFTTRTTRRVGLGLSLLAENARATGGDVQVCSKPGEGTTVTAWFQRSHIDRQPLGDIAATLTVVMAAAPEVDLSYRHEVDGQVFAFGTRELRENLGGNGPRRGGLPVSHPAVVWWAREHIREGESGLEVAEV